MTEPEIWTLDGFLDHFMTMHQDMPDRSFAFVLGAGASRASGVPTGIELVDRWLQELHVRQNANHKTTSLGDWATAANLGIQDFAYNRRANFYPQVYDRRFGADPEEGYAELEKIMESKEPSFGYSVLATILASTNHHIVITTNFDDLVADALFIYTRKRPLVCGHESLAEFLRPSMRRPVIAKLHRDLLLAPMNQPKDVSRLDERWSEALRSVFRYSSSIFIGYGGNDGSLMGLLEKLDPAQTVGRPAWCYYDKGEVPDERIRNVVGRLRGFLVPIPGFDELMLLLNDRFGYPLLADTIIKEAHLRAEKYRKSFEEMQSRPTVTTTPVGTEANAGGQLKEALDSAVERTAGWWSYYLKAQSNPNEAEQIFVEGLKEFPDSPILLIRLADILHKDRRDEEAEKLYRKAAQYPECDAYDLGYIAGFFEDTGRYDEAERFYRLAIQKNPAAFALSNLATFLYKRRQNLDEASDLFQRALEIDPSDSFTLWSFANLEVARGNYSRAEQLLRENLSRNPEDHFASWKLGNFLEQQRKDFPQAEQHYRKSLAIDPDDPTTIAGLARVLMERGEKIEEAETLLRRLVELKPFEPMYLESLANVLERLGRAPAEVDELRKKAEQLRKGNPANLK